MGANRVPFLVVTFLLAASVAWHGLNLCWIDFFDGGSGLGFVLLLYLPLGFLFFETLRRYPRFAGRGFPVWAALLFGVCHVGILLGLGRLFVEGGGWGRSLWDELSWLATGVDMVLIFFSMLILSWTKGKKVP